MVKFYMQWLFVIVLVGTHGPCVLLIFIFIILIKI